MVGEVPERERVMSMGEWLVTLIITAIPLINLIMLFIWAFGDNANHNRANYSKAALIVIAIGLVLQILFWGTFMGAILSGID